MKSIVILALIIILTFSQKHNVTQVTERTFESQLQKSQFTVLYVYSSSCGYCQQFTPLYEKLSKDVNYAAQSVRFLKVDENLFKNYTSQFAIHSYPTVMIFWKGYNQFPIFFRQERTQPILKEFISRSIKINQDNIDQTAELSPYQRVDDKIVLYYGTKSSSLYKHLGLVSNRDRFFSWKLIPINEGEQQKIIIGNKQLMGQDLTVQELQKIIARVFARVHTLGEQPWVRIFMNKQLGIIHINPNKNTKYASLLQSLAKENTEVVFLELTPQHPEYKDALRTFAIYDEENIIAVDRKVEGVFVADSPYTKDSLQEFIQKVQKYQWPVYKKTQKTNKQQKLTRDNFKQRMSTAQDVVLFLYRRQQKISKNLIDLFTHLRNKLQQNKNLLFLRCDVASNQIQEYLQFAVQKTPKIVFYRNRMKDRPIHFSSNKISQSSVIEFIMENTTFDWNDEWAEL